MLREPESEESRRSLVSFNGFNGFSAVVSTEARLECFVDVSVEILF